MTKLELNLDSTALGSSTCILNLIRTIVGDPAKPDEGAYRQKVNGVKLNYGVAIHKFIDTMYKTRGNYGAAREESVGWFERTPHIPASKQPWMSDSKHLLTTCFQVWTLYVEQDGGYEVLSLPGKCYWCKGTGAEHGVMNVKGLTKLCKHCSGSGQDKTQAATEVTFSIPFYEDDYIKVNLCGTLDRIGKYKGGVYAVRDWKSTGVWDKDEYFTQYEMSRQLRMYTLACKLMARRFPDSVLGQIGATHMGAAIDAIFLNKNANDTECRMSDVFQYSIEDMTEFELMLGDTCRKISSHVRDYYFPKEGVINGSCTGKYGSLCQYWVPCKLPPVQSEIILGREFKRQKYDPMAFND